MCKLQTKLINTYPHFWLYYSNNNFKDNVMHVFHHHFSLSLVDDSQVCDQDEKNTN